MQYFVVEKTVPELSLNRKYASRATSIDALGLCISSNKSWTVDPLFVPSLKPVVFAAGVSLKGNGG